MTSLPLSEGVTLTLQDQTPDERTGNETCTECYFNHLEVFRGLPTTSCLRTELHKFECCKHKNKVWKVKI